MTGFLYDAFQEAVNKMLRQADFHFVVSEESPYVVYEEIGRRSEHVNCKCSTDNFIDSTAVVIDPDVLALPAPLYFPPDNYIAMLSSLLGKSYSETKTAIELSGMSPRQVYEAASSNVPALQSAQFFCDAMNTLTSMTSTSVVNEYEKCDAIFLEIIEEVRRERNDHLQE